MQEVIGCKHLSENSFFRSLPLCFYYDGTNIIFRRVNVGKEWKEKNHCRFVHSSANDIIIQRTQCSPMFSSTVPIVHLTYEDNLFREIDHVSASLLREAEAETQVRKKSKSIVVGSEESSDGILFKEINPVET